MTLPSRTSAPFAEKTYHRRDLSGFKGDPKFVRDDDAQKAFLNSAVQSPASIPGDLAGLPSGLSGAKTDRRTAADPQRGWISPFRQAFAFCPYSPEAVFRYVNLLASTRRFDDALAVAETCRKLDPYNGQVAGFRWSISRT